MSAGTSEEAAAAPWTRGFPCSMQPPSLHDRQDWRTRSCRLLHFAPGSARHLKHAAAATDPAASDGGEGATLPRPDAARLAGELGSGRPWSRATVLKLPPLRRASGCELRSDTGAARASLGLGL